VLLVEDDAGIGRVVRKGLANHGIDVDWVRTAGEVPAQVQRRVYGAIVLDLMLPDGDGFGVCRDLRARGIDTPVCMLTARDALDDKLEGFDAGADDYLTKPFAVDELAARLRVLLRRLPAPETASHFGTGDVSLNLTTREATAADQDLLLTRREFDTLAFLLQRAGCAVSREDLLDAVWQAERSVTPNAVDVYVGYLRKKLTAAGSVVRIEAVRGIGFKLV
jgi:DNA-binding response OmpR family regulator